MAFLCVDRWTILGCVRPMLLGILRACVVARQAKPATQAQSSPVRILCIENFDSVVDSKNCASRSIPSPLFLTCRRLAILVVIILKAQRVFGYILGIKTGRKSRARLCSRIFYLYVFFMLYIMFEPGLRRSSLAEDKPRDSGGHSSRSVELIRNPCEAWQWMGISRD